MKLAIVMALVCGLVSCAVYPRYYWMRGHDASLVCWDTKFNRQVDEFLCPDVPQ